MDQAAGEESLALGAPAPPPSRHAELETRIAQLSGDLQRHEAFTQLTASTLHDTHNALHVILGHADLLRLRIADPESVESLVAVRTAAEHASALCRDLLRLSARETARPEHLDTARFLAECERLVLGVGGRRFEVEFDVAAELWPVDVVRQQFLAAVVNLAVNARDAMPEGGHLLVTARNFSVASGQLVGLRAGDYVRFTFEDDGIGMTPDVLARAIEPFYTTKADHGGTGLGLPMVDSFARQAGGAFRLLSEPGRGTRAEIWLPRTPAAAPLHAEPEGESALLERIGRRIRTAWLREALAAWAAAGDREVLPHPVRIEEALIGHIDQTIVLTVNVTGNPPVLQLQRLGSGLVHELQAVRPDVLALGDAEVPLALGQSYSRVLRSARPVYLSARYSFGVGDATQFEHLILPASQNGRTVTHLFGVVVLTPARRAGGES